MLSSRFLILFSALSLTCGICARADSPTTVKSLRESFASPPTAARPWVYWTWLSSNVSRESITADLEAMQRVGIGGATILDVQNGTPPGTMQFFDEQWKEMIKHTVSESKRLGMEISINNGPGYFGSGGSWVTPEQGMQSVFTSETQVTGGTSWSGVLPIPPNSGAYKDIAVFAVPATKTDFKIKDFAMKSLSWDKYVGYSGVVSAPPDATAPADAIIPSNRVIDLTAQMQSDGSLTWNAPSGEWIILRMGHAYNGRWIKPSPKAQSGPETDKLSREATVHHFNSFVKRLSDITGPEMKSALVATHIDSWESGGQNWTSRMREEFTRRRGYDPLPYLPIMTGRVLGDLQTTERFLWDLRKTVSELMVQNYVATFQELAHGQGLRFSYEGYTTTGNDLDAANHADEPMAEFWTPTGQGMDFYSTMKGMASAAHLNGRPVVSAEAFTANEKERWLWHPAMLKAIGDDAFTQGINRVVFHRYAAQFLVDQKPGMQMSRWGLHYERTNTWWEWSGPWHTYLARAQHLLRQGEFVADVLALQSEEPLQRFQAAPIPGYDYDGCGPNTFATVRAQDGNIVLPSGRAYRLLTLTHSGTMTVPMLKHIRDLVREGVAVLGNPPVTTPGLSGFPQVEAELKLLIDELWGTSALVPERRLGQGRVFTGMKPEEALARLGIETDFKSDKKLGWIHRRAQGTDIYFVANTSADSVTTTAHFRATGHQPELWNAETGGIMPASVVAVRDSTTAVRLHLKPAESVFVVFPAEAPAPVVVNPSPNAPSAPVVLQSLTGPWQVAFHRKEFTFDTLYSWSEHTDTDIKYFSGETRYAKTIEITPGQLTADNRLYLDLGDVQVMARVSLNGRDLGILWKPPYRVEITDFAKAGVNTLQITVVNLWPNRLIGDEQLPEDSERKDGVQILSWPQWLLDGKPSPTGRVTFSTWRLWKKDDPLQPSGLLGPVTLQAVAAPANQSRN